MPNTEEIFDHILQEQRITNTILRAAFRPQLDALLSQLLDDEVDGAIIRQLVDGKKSAGALTTAVTKAAEVRPRTVRLHMTDLLTQGIVDRLGQGPSTAYQLSGLLSAPQISKLRPARAAKGAEGAIPEEAPDND